MGYGVGGGIITLFTLVLDRRKVSAILPQEKSHRTKWIGGYVGPNAGLNVLEKIYE